MRYILVSSMLPESMEDKLNNYGKVIKVPSFSMLPSPTSTHVDMQIANINGTLFLNYKNENLKNILNSIGLNYIEDDSDNLNTLSGEVKLNTFVTHNKLFFGKYTSNKIIDFSKENGIEIIQTKQHYQRCSSLYSDDFVISADKSIINACKENNVDYLEISPNGIEIDTYDYGFIGGASGIIDKNVFFFGNIDLHKDSKIIKEYLYKKGYKVLSLGDGNLYDYGSFIVIER